MSFLETHDHTLEDFTDPVCASPQCDEPVSLHGDCCHDCDPTCEVCGRPWRRDHRCNDFPGELLPFAGDPRDGRLGGPDGALTQRPSLGRSSRTLFASPDAKAPRTARTAGGQAHTAPMEAA